MKKFVLNEVGIGDIIIFLSYLSEFYKNDVIYYDFNINNIKIHRTKEFEEYYNFIKNFSKYVLDKANCNTFLLETLHNGYTLITIDDIRNHYKTNNIEFQYISINKSNNISNNTVVLLTKVRGCHYEKYNEIKNDFYKTINNGNKNIILLGEKEIELNPEYLLLTDQVVYSIYNDILHNVDNNKIIDLTIDKLGITSPSLKKLIDDISIIENNKVISFGSSGIVSLCSLFTDVLSYINAYNNETLELFNQFLDPHNKELKHNNEDFINNLKLILK